MSPNQSFFDPRLIGIDGAAFLDPAKLEGALLRLIPRAHISKGHFTYPGKSELRDLVWNHMDQNHRPYIHRTYGEAARLFVDPHGSFSLTRYGRWPIAIPVFDGYFRENGFYQVMVLFGLLIVVNIIECNEDHRGTRMDVSWVMASHRWLRFLHPILSRRFTKLNDVQNREDDPIRDRRIELRAANYRFATDNPDFLNSNVIANNVQFPTFTGHHSIAIKDLPEAEPHRAEVGDRAYIIRRSGQQLEVWPGVCPHEGAVLGAADVAGKLVRCPWHGLEFGARRFGPGGGKVVMCGAQLEINGDCLTISPVQG